MLVLTVKCAPFHVVVTVAFEYGIVNSFTSINLYNSHLMCGLRLALFLFLSQDSQRSWLVCSNYCLSLNVWVKTCIVFVSFSGLPEELVGLF